MRHAILLAAGLSLAAALPAHAISFNVGLVGDMPTGDLEDVAELGYGVYGRVDRSLAPLINSSFQVEMNRFTGQDLPGGGQVEDFTSWGFLTGASVKFLGMLNGGLLVGYYTEVDEFDLVPFLGMRFGLIDAGLQYKMLGDAQWFGLKAGVSFGTPGL